VYNIEKRFFKGTKVATLILGMIIFAFPIRFLNDTLYFNTVSLMIDLSTTDLNGDHSPLATKAISGVLLIC